MSRTSPKLWFAASSGGHYEQLMMLKPLMQRYDSFVLPEKTQYKAKAKEEDLLCGSDQPQGEDGAAQARCQCVSLPWHLHQGTARAGSMISRGTPHFFACLTSVAPVPPFERGLMG